MSRARNQAEPQKPIPDAVMAGILALLVDARARAIADEKGATRTEVLLANAGMSIEDISAVTGKTYDAVRMAIRRGRAK